MTLTAVPGVEVGHRTDAEGGTGVTVVVLPEPNVTAVEIREGEATKLDFYMTDVVPPAITTTEHPDTGDEGGPYPIPVTIVDYSGLAAKALYYRVNYGEFQGLPLVPQGGNDYLAEIPGQSLFSVI